MFTYIIAVKKKIVHFPLPNSFTILHKDPSDELRKSELE